jgi:predicted  nucleic acid-binding Zn-ribbon protein
MLEDIKLLIELQDIDYWLGELERSKEYIPDMMNNLRQEMEKIATELQESKDRVQQAKVEAQELELKIAESKEHLEKYQEQMLTIKTNKEYDALVAQIEATKTEIESEEETYVNTLDEVEQLEKKIAELDEQNEKVQKDNSERLESLQHEIDSVEGKMEEKVSYRQTLKAKVPRNVMSVYQRVRKGRGGDVVVRLKRGACGACYKQQTPQKIQLIRNGDSMQTCDSCGRILIWEGDD